MFTVEVVREFLGWSALINIGLLMLSAIFIVVFREMALKIHIKMFDLDKNYLLQSYFKYLAQYKILIIIFNIVPYFALRLIS